jgi:hypothetical protein
MKFARFWLWTLGVHVCDRMPLQGRVPWCLYLHGLKVPDAPESWWRWAGWGPAQRARSN